MWASGAGEGARPTSRSNFRKNSAAEYVLTDEKAEMTLGSAG